MLLRWKNYALFASLALVICPGVLKAGQKLDPNSHVGKVAHAMQLFQTGKYHEAEVEFRALLDEDEKTKGLDHADTLQDRKNLAIVLGVEGNYLDSENILREGIELETSILGAENKDVLEFRELLATTYAREGRTTEAVHDFRDILAIRQRTAKPGDIAISRAMSNLGSVLVDTGAYAEAEKLLREAQPGLDKGLQANDAAILLNHTNLSKCLIGLGRYPEAEKEQRIIISTLEQFLGMHPEVALAKLNLAATLRQEKKLPEALELARVAETQLSQMLGPDNEKSKEAHQMRKEIAAAEAKNGAK
jgi:tetratricopeptide (TPR) repeat protein